ncbi:hypothetical protein JZU68_07975, partial [bacterium]|nr:hypothetical protein [bacterium]
MKSIHRKSVSGMNYGIQNLWITEGNRLYAYKNGVKSLYCVVQQCKSPIERILETADERIILGTLSSGVFVIDQNKKVRTLL